MFKLVVLCAFLAAATATPGLIAPLSYSANVLAPAPAVYASNPSSLVYSSPFVASAPLAVSTPYGFSHFIKKRSAPLAVSSYIAPSTYVASTPLVNTYAAPLATTYAAPLATTYSSPLAVSTPYGFSHFIKKRSAPFAVSSYIAPSTYVASAPLVNTYAGPLATTYAAPLATTYSSPLYTTAHLIKKRSVVVPSTYIAPTTYAGVSPFIASTYAASPLVSTPYVAAAPIAYGPHFIKKRSAPLAIAPVTAYSAPASFSHQSRFDFQATSPAITTYSSYASPAIYPSVGVSHLF